MTVLNEFLKNVQYIEESDYSPIKKNHLNLCKFL